MTDPSSDERLLALLDEKSPDEFTPTELAELDARSAASAELRAAIVERLRIEQALHAVLGDPQIEAKAILRRTRRRRTRKLALLGGLAAAVLVAAAVGLWLSWDFRTLRHREPPPATVASDASPDLAGIGTAGDSQPDAPPQTVASRRQNPVEAPRPSESTVQPGAMSDVATAVDPWAATLSDEAPVLPFAESAFASFGETVPGYEVADEFPASEFRRWVEPVPGRPFEVSEGQWRGHRFAGLTGTARLRPAWRSDAVLRLAPFDLEEFALHLWHGPRGVTIRYYPQQRPRMLAAYAASRESGDPRPTGVRLIATDSGRYDRSNAGAMELRHQDGAIVVTRGGLPLLVVPAELPPDEIVLEGKFRLRTLDIYRGSPAPLPAPKPRRHLLGDVPIEQLDWMTSDEPAANLERTQGQVELSTDGSRPDSSPSIVWAGVRLPSGTAGLSEFVFQIDSLSVGTGLYFGDAEGRPVQTLFAARSEHVDTPILAEGWSSRDGTVPEIPWDRNVDPTRELTATIGQRTWIKLVAGQGGMKTFVSGDGVNWGFATRSPLREFRDLPATIGVFAVADDQPRSIALSAIDVGELTSIVSIADPALRQQVPQWRSGPPERSSDWLQWTAATRPEDVAAEDWLQACAVETLARGAGDDVSRGVLAGLLRSAVASDRPVSEVLALLSDAALVAACWRDRSAMFAEHYQRLARRITEREPVADQVAGDSAAIAEGFLAAPIWSEDWPWALPPAAVRNLAAAEVWHAETSGTPSEVLSEASRAARVASLLTPSHPESGWATESEAGLARLAAWAGSSSRSEAGSSRAVMRFGWRHPLVTEPSREAQTLIGELEAALEAGAWRDAAGLLGTIAALPELVPATGDPDRFVPPAGLIAEVADRHPDLITTLDDEFGPAGLLHVRESIAAGDEAALQAATVRYFGTAAAAEAHRWLGDRDLASGQFARAEHHFAAALQSTPDSESSPIAARRTLAATLAGKETATPATDAVTFGSQTLSPEEFETLLDKLRQTRTAGDAEPTVRRPELPPPVAVAPQSRGRFEGDVGRNPSRYEYRSIDWVGQQIGVAKEERTAYLTNRFQLVAFDLRWKRVAWMVGLGNEQGEAHALPNIAFRPLVRGGRVFVRRLLQRGPELACLAIGERGKLLWRSESNLVVASDPVFDSERLIVVTAASTARSGGPFTLSLTRLRTDDGTTMASTPLIVLHEAGDEKPWAHLVATGDGFLIAAAGTLLRCDGSGNPLWVQRLPHLSRSVDSDADRVSPERPHLVGDRLLYALPGGRAIVCLDTATGRILWFRALGELQGLIDVAGPIAIARLTDGVLALNVDDGTTAWSLPCDNLLSGTLCDTSTLLVAARTPLEDRRDGLSLLQVEVAGGHLLSEQIVRVERNEEIRCGPLFLHDGNVWGFVGDGWRDPTRTLVEFVPDDSLPTVKAAADPGSIRHWVSPSQPQSRLNAATVLPGWTMTGTQPGKGAAFLDEFQGEPWVMRTQDDRTHSASFVKRLDVQPGQKLVARVGRDDDTGWTLRLLADGRVVASETVDAQTAPDGWRTVTFDLAPLAGRTVTIALEQSPPSADVRRRTKAYWKQVTIE